MPLPLPRTDSLHTRELQPADLPLLQAMFDANPAYFQTVNGRPADADEAQREFDEQVPAHLSSKRRWFLGWFDAQQQVAGVSIVVEDLCAPRVWHLALFLLATHLHGRGVAQPAYQAVEDWARSQGARWMRLGVVATNGRARRFWQRLGFVDLRLRTGVDTGGRVNDIHVCCKPLHGGSLAEYLALVPRDTPGSTLP